MNFLSALNGRSDAPRQATRGWTVAAFCGCLLLAFLLRVPGLGDKELWLDEIFQVDLVSQADGAAHLLRLVSESTVEGHPPFTYLANRAFFRFGANEFNARLPSALFALMTVALLFHAGRRWFGWKVGVLAATILAVARFHIEVSQDARPYSAFAFFALLALYLGVRLFGERTRCAWRTAGFILSSTLLCYIHFLGFALLAAGFGMLLLLRRDEWRRLGIAAAIDMALLAPLVGQLATKARHQIHGGLPGLTLSPVELLEGWAQLHGGSYLWLACCGLLVLAGVVSAREKEGVVFRVCLIWVVVSYSAVLLTLKSGHRFFAPRYVVHVLPVWLLLVSTGLNLSLRRLSGSYGRWAVGAVFLLMLALGNRSLWGYYTTPQQPWRSLVSFLADNTQTGDIVLVEPSYLTTALLYHIGENEIYRTPANVSLNGTVITVAPSAMLDNRAELSIQRRMWYITNSYDRELNHMEPDPPEWVTANYRLESRFEGLRGTFEVYRTPYGPETRSATARD